GGIERGTVTILSGPSGVGKTTTGLQFLTAASGRGDRAVLYTFEEEVINLVNRAAAINIPAKEKVSKGDLSIVKIEPMQYAPDEFAALVRREVENHETQIIMLDSISGYSLTMEGDDLVSHLHALCKYLTNMGVTVLVINETESLAGGDLKATEDGFTYLADNLILMRYMERHEDGQVELRKNISVVKKRLSDFEKTLREFKITTEGIKVSRPLEGLDGILSAEAITLDKDEADSQEGEGEGEDG
ncbi:MAG: ATPase domain-containing protein, partial [Cyanobacteria bacterium J06555_13]